MSNQGGDFIPCEKFEEVPNRQFANESKSLGAKFVITTFVSGIPTSNATGSFSDESISHL